MLKGNTIMKFNPIICQGITQFVAQFTNQSHEDASENNCEMIEWIESCIESAFYNAYYNSVQVTSNSEDVGNEFKEMYNKIVVADKI